MGLGEGPLDAILESVLTAVAGLGDAAREYAANGLRKDLFPAG
jgi:hypothetical protein